MSRSVTFNEFQPIVDNIGYKFKDISLDIHENANLTGVGLYSGSNTTDIEDSLDFQAVTNSITNIFNTTPGEKILSPYFGLNLKQYLFDPISVNTAENIGDTIILGITRWEPRVRVDKVDVLIDFDQQQFEITLRLSIPSLNNSNMSLTGTLSNSGFAVTNE